MVDEYIKKFILFYFKQ